LSVVVILVFTLFGLTPSAQEPGSEETSFAEMGAPTFEEFTWTDEPAALTEEQIAQLEDAAEHTGLPGPALGGGQDVAGPVPGTESLSEKGRERSGQPLLPGDAVIFRRKTNAGDVVPAGRKSNIMESSVGTSGKYVFTTGNWFAARSGSGGRTWRYVDPFAGFPPIGTPGYFCCDQVTLYDEARDIFLWLRMGTGYVDGTGNYENVFKLGVSKRDAVNWWTYTVEPMDVNGAWTNQWWDYPHIQLGADYVYIAWNMFNQYGSWTRSVMLRWPLDALAAGAGFGYNYYDDTNWFTFVPVQGAYHTMYWASNWPTYSTNYNFRIWRWQEDETTIYWWYRTTRDAWTPTGRGDAHCGDPNWAARYDQRLLTGARYSINNAGLVDPKILGRKILGWWWNVGEGGGFDLPYIDAAAFYEDNLTQVGGWLGRPYVWSGSYCFAYPSCTPNKRQDLGMVFNYADGEDLRPDVGFAIADDYVHAPPGWSFYTVVRSKALPSDEVWGDYNTVREFEPTQKTWVAGAHFIENYTYNCSRCSDPVYFVFGRERDFWSWERWRSR